ncbi:MAG: hypothetical protein JEY99_18820 [Spirochaetales bacterium]|nr:hypothetical protein [Spirochaetales bacterium]
MKFITRSFTYFSFVILLGSCVSVEDIVMQKAGEILSSDSSGSVFTGDDDPQLIADALPLTMKLYEMVLSGQPENPALNFSTGKNFILYANAFIHTPAEMLPDEAWMENEKMLIRAKKMYLRGRNYILESLNLSYPGWNGMLTSERLEEALSLCTAEDVPRLYWAASAWIGSFSCNPFDFDLGTDLHIPVAMLFRALELDADYGEGSIHSILIQVYASLPRVYVIKALDSSPDIISPFIEEYYKTLGIGDDFKERSHFHFKQAVLLSRGNNPSPYIAAAKSLAVPVQDYPMFEELLNKAIEIDPLENPEKQLEITIYQEKARWLLENRENYFILDFGE